MTTKFNGDIFVFTEKVEAIQENIKVRDKLNLIISIILIILKKYFLE